MNGHPQEMPDDGADDRAGDSALVSPSSDSEDPVTLGPEADGFEDGELGRSPWDAEENESPVDLWE